MGALGVREASGGEESAVRAGRPEPSFRSAAELREVLDCFLDDVDGDPEAGTRMRSARVPHRFVFPDMDVVLNVTGSEHGGHCLRWRFSDEIDWQPALTLEMDSAVANRYLQGEENLAIALARGRIRISAQQAGAALSFLPVSRSLFGRYRALVARRYPHLALS
jgi:hypothetical protein